MLISKIFFYLISPFFLFFVFIIFPFLKLRFFFLSAERIEELVYQTESYYLIKKNNTEKRQFDIFFTGDIISNNFYLYLLKKNFFILNGVIVFPIFLDLKQSTL